MASVSRHSTGSAQVPDITVTNAIGSQILVGDGCVQISVLLGGASRLDDLDGRPALRATTLPVLPSAERADPIGREEIIAGAAADLAAGRSVQLVGAPGVGRTAVARAVSRRLGAQQLRGVHLHGGGEPWTLRLLYERLAKVFFSLPWDNPDETVLRAAVAETDLAGVVVVTDCDLGSAELTRLLDTFPSFVFLITSPQQTLAGESTARYEVDPLTGEQARELLTRQLAADPVSRQNVQFDEAYRLSEGQPQRLLQHAAFIRRAADRAEQTERIPVPFPEQIALLVAGLTEPARRVLVALADFGVDIDVSLLPAVTGLEGTRDAVDELAKAHLIRLEDTACRVDPDATAAVADQKVDPQAAADGLMPLLTGVAGTPDAAPAPVPGARLLLAVAQGLHGTGQPSYTSRFARAAAPVALAAGDTTTWTRLVVLGAQAATEAKRNPDLEYFLKEQRNGHLAAKNTIAAAAVLLMLSELAKTELLTTTTTTTTTAGAHTVSRAEQVNRAHGRKLIHQGRRVLSAGHGAAAAGAAVVVAAAVVAAIALSAKPAAKPAAAAVKPSASPTFTAWTVGFKDAPSTPLTGPATIYTTAAQYPVITAGVASAALQKKFDDVLQQPIVQFATEIAQSDQGNGTAPGPAYTETTTIKRAGEIITLDYSFIDVIPHNGGYPLLRMSVRMDTGTAFTSESLFTPAAYSTQAGLTQIANAINGGIPADQKTGICGTALATTDVSATLTAPSGSPGTGSFIIGVQAGGFHITVPRADCGSADFVVPFGQLTGLVNPEVLALANGANSGGATSTPSAG